MGEGIGGGGEGAGGGGMQGFGGGHSQGDAALLGQAEASITPAGTAFGNQFADVGALSQGDAKSMGLGPGSKIGGIIGAGIGGIASALSGMPGAMAAGREIGSRVGGGGFTGTSGPISAGNTGRGGGAPGGPGSGEGASSPAGGGGEGGATPAQGPQGAGGTPTTISVPPQHVIGLAQAITQRDPMEVGLSLSGLALPSAEAALGDLQQRLRITQQALRLNKTRQGGGGGARRA